MFSRFAKRAPCLARSFSDYTYTASVTNHGMRNVTLIPGVYIGPETCRSMLNVIEAVHAPINFDIIDNFCFSNAEHKEKIKKNQTIMVGNLGESNARYIENTKFYKWLDLYVNGRCD
jgi:isocitrate/isopropylmalate dehydrogenase